jgi:hypothetical protein
MAKQVITITLDDAVNGDTHDITCDVKCEFTKEEGSMAELSGLLLEKYMPSVLSQTGEKLRSDVERIMSAQSVNNTH